MRVQVNISKGLIALFAGFCVVLGLIGYGIGVVIGTGLSLLG